MVSNFDGLPDYVAFLHGDPKSWHAQYDANTLTHTHPDDVQMLAGEKCIWPEPGPFDRGGHGPMSTNANRPALDLLYNAFFSMTFNEAWDTWHMHGEDKNSEKKMTPHRAERRGTTVYKCCSEMVVNSDRIRNVGKPVLEALVTLIDTYPDAPWGWVYEAFWQNLFLANHQMRPRREVLKYLNVNIAKLSAAGAGKDRQMVRGDCTGFYSHMSHHMTSNSTKATKLRE